MSKYELYESGKGSREEAGVVGRAHIVINADGTKPRMMGNFDDTLNEVVGKTILVDKWNDSFPMYYTTGKNLRKDYADALQAKRGMFTLEANLLADNSFDIELCFVDSSTPDFEVISFRGINFDVSTRILKLPFLENDDHSVFLEEALPGMLRPAFDAVIARCAKLGFVNKLYYGFTVNKYGCPVDQRNRVLVQVRR